MINTCKIYHFWRASESCHVGIPCRDFSLHHQNYLAFCNILAPLQTLGFSQECRYLYIEWGWSHFDYINTEMAEPIGYINANWTLHGVCPIWVTFTDMKKFVIVVIFGMVSQGPKRFQISLRWPQETVKLCEAVGQGGEDVTLLQFTHHKVSIKLLPCCKTTIFPPLCDTKRTQPAQHERRTDCEHTHNLYKIQLLLQENKCHVLNAARFAGVHRNVHQKKNIAPRSLRSGPWWETMMA